jgi:hypothetical protein
MLRELVDVERVLVYKMGKLIVHKLSNEALTEKRQMDFFKLSHQESMRKAFQLLRVAQLFSKEKPVLFGKHIMY